MRKKGSFPTAFPIDSVIVAVDNLTVPFDDRAKSVFRIFLALLHLAVFFVCIVWSAFSPLSIVSFTFGQFAPFAFATCASAICAVYPLRRYRDDFYSTLIGIVKAASFLSLVYVGLYALNLHTFFWTAPDVRSFPFCPLDASDRAFAMDADRDDFVFVRMLIAAFKNQTFSAIFWILASSAAAVINVVTIVYYFFE